jgi:hypothetical protein
MKTSFWKLGLTFASAVFLIGACGGDENTDPIIDPTDVKFGDTALIVVVNPLVNDANGKQVPAPGPTSAGVRLTTDDGVSVTTGAAGIAVLGPLTPGVRTITVDAEDISGSFTVELAEGELRELALASEGQRAEIMVDIDYKSARVTEIVPTMTIEEVNDTLAVSDTLVFFRSGLYEGNLDFSGSRVTLFGEGVLGGEVVLSGDIVVSGSNSRIRGTLITGSLDIPASGVGISFSRVEGDLTVEGSDATLLANAFCGAASVTGSGAIVLGNAGLDPEIQCFF